MSKELCEKQKDALDAVEKCANNINHLLKTIEADVKIIDKRWFAIGRTELQQGLMAIRRSISKPDVF